MTTETEELTLDLDALDAAAASMPAAKGKEPAKPADDEPTVVVEPAVAAAAAGKPVLTPEAGLETLRKQLEDERAGRIAAEQRANEAAQGEAAARTDVQKTNLDLIKGAIEQITQANVVLKAKYAAALSSQDHEAAADVQMQMSTNAAKLIQLDAGKTALEKAPKPVPRAPTDPVEAFCAQLSRPSADWVRTHPEFVRDAKKNRAMIRAHEAALDDGIKADTPAYFRSIEMALGVSSPVESSDGARPNGHAATVEDDPTADISATTAAGGRSTAPAAAPVTRNGNGAGGARPNVVRLTPEEVEMARNMFPDSKDPTLDYARNKAALKKEGKL